MGKICYINGQPYMVSLPTGGKTEGDRVNQWDEMINFLGEDCSHIFHWERMGSWCQEKKDRVLLCACRGYTSARFWGYSTASVRGVSVGFRPVFVPLDTDTLKPDPFLLEDIPDGRIIALASLYMDGKVVKNPANPTYKGDISDYIPGTEIVLGDRDHNKKNWLRVIKYKDLLWADRNILQNISWEDLKKQGFTPEEQ